MKRNFNIQYSISNTQYPREGGFEGRDGTPCRPGFDGAGTTPCRKDFNIQFPREGCVRTLATSDPLQVPINRRHHSPQRAKTIPNSPPYSAASCIQPMDFVSALDPFGHTENIRSGNPVTTLCSGIADDEMSMGSFIVKDKTVECNSCMNFIEYNDTTLERMGLQWTNPDGLSIANSWVHTGPARFEDNGRVLMQQFLDDSLTVGHKRTIPYLKGVGKT